MYIRAPPLSFPTAPPLRVEVTEADIRTGLRGLTPDGPIARAVSRIVPDRGVSVTGICVWIKGRRADGRGQSLWSYPLPARVRRWRDAFDLGEDVWPIRFMLVKGTIWS